MYGAYFFNKMYKKFYGEFFRESMNCVKLLCVSQTNRSFCCKYKGFNNLTKKQVCNYVSFIKYVSGNIGDYFLYLKVKTRNEIPYYYNTLYN